MQTPIRSHLGPISWMPHTGVATVVKHQTTVDENTKTQLEERLMTHKTHDGIVHLKAITLPPRLVESVKTFMKDKPKKDLESNIKDLTNYLWSRKRPVEEVDMRKYAKTYAMEQGVADIDDSDVNSTNLSKEIKVKMSTVMKKLKMNLYNWKPIKYDEEVGVTYLMARLAPNYAAIYRVLSEIKKRVPDFNPQAILDFGSGLGSTVWASHQLWRSNVQQYYCVDTSMVMHNIAENILCGGNKEENKPYLETVYLRHFLPVGSRVTFDIIVSAYALLELPSKQERLKTIETLWKKTDHFLILIENGTIEGYKALLEARDFMLQENEANVHETNSEGKWPSHRVSPGQNIQGGHVFAPCQHDLVCPLLAAEKNHPCNFEQNYIPLTLSATTPQPVPERFSYLVLRKGLKQSRDAHWPRLVQQVISRSKHVVCNLCCANGTLEQATLTKSKHGHDLYRCARNSRWGDLLPISKPIDDQQAIFNPVDGASLSEQEMDQNQCIQSEPN